MKKGFILGLITGAVLAGASLVFASSQIQAILNDQIKVTLNGQIQKFKDETTNETQYPITYKNRTYLPLRTVANLVDVDVDYDVNTNTAVLEAKENHFTEKREIKKALLDEEWVKKNLYLNIGHELATTNICFAPMDNGTVLVKVKSFLQGNQPFSYAIQYILVYYKEGQVRTNLINFYSSNEETSEKFYQVSREESIIHSSYFHNGKDFQTYYTINENYQLQPFTTINHIEYENDLSERVYEGNDLVIKYDINIDGFMQSGTTMFSPFINSLRRYESQFNLKDINTELTTENVKNML